MIFQDASCSDNVIRSRLAESPLWQAVKDICADEPRIIGHCQFDKGSHSPIPTFLALDHTGTYSFALYSQHSPQYLRHYVLKWSAPAVSSDPYHALASHDFTLPKPRQIEKALNAVAVEQVGRFVSVTTMTDFLSDQRRISRRLRRSEPRKASEALADDRNAAPDDCGPFDIFLASLTWYMQLNLSLYQPLSTIPTKSEAWSFERRLRSRLVCSLAPLILGLMIPQCNR